MKDIIATLLLLLPMSSAMAAPETPSAQQPSAKQLAQRERMKDCNADAGDKKGDERKAFMSECLKGHVTPASVKQRAQRNKMKVCNKEANDKALKGKERQSYMSACLRD